MTTKTDENKEPQKEKKPRKPRAKAEPIKTFSLVGKRDIKQQKDIIKEAIDYHTKELDKWNKKQEKLDKQLKDEEWKAFLDLFTEEEIKERLGL